MTKRNEILALVVGVVAIIAAGIWAFNLGKSQKELLTASPTIKQEQEPAETSSPIEGSLAPLFTLENLKGQEIALEDLRGKKTLLVFFSTRCSWCIKEVPHLNELYEENKSDIEIMAISLGEAKNTVSNFVKEYEINYTVLLDKDLSVAKRYQITGTPSNFVIDEEGKISAILPGYAEKEELEELIQ
ncbi:MAG TPA: redoxin domain-containing protein [Candidatus Portnoybacteria bacterium]|nr:redoxin domain-containing protein [Candidatus Portnoybacteria bacterium]